ncbi:MAG TPA: hypothetical protein PKK26_14085 [Candidatus Wallbacteria bacterium]|nr:hypothetical protein [Candidatus Wallbacteria bacterium]
MFTNDILDGIGGKTTEDIGSKYFGYKNEDICSKYYGCSNNEVKKHCKNENLNFNNGWEGNQSGYNQIENFSHESNNRTSPPPTMYEYGKKVIMYSDKTEIGYFMQTSPNPWYSSFFNYVTGIFRNEITGKTIEVTVRDMNGDLSVWGVISSIYKSFKWN